MRLPYGRPPPATHRLHDSSTPTRPCRPAVERGPCAGNQDAEAIGLLHDLPAGRGRGLEDAVKHVGVDAHPALNAGELEDILRASFDPGEQRKLAAAGARLAGRRERDTIAQLVADERLRQVRQRKSLVGNLALDREPLCLELLLG